jgi:glycine cleavage system H lipoate-binding protein
MFTPDTGAEGKRQRMEEVFGFQVPTSDYYFHRGHAWVLIEEGQVKVGLDDFSQKILGPPDEFKLPGVGKVYYQNHVCMAHIRQSHKASFLAPVDGTIKQINQNVRERPSLVYDDPYGEGWLFMVTPINLQSNLANLSSGEANLAFIEAESHRLLSLMESRVHATFPTGGEIIADVYGNYPLIGWRTLVKEFFLPILTQDWKKRA